MDRRKFLQGAAAAAGALALGGAASSEWKADPGFKVKIKDEEKEEPTERERPLLYGIGMIWAMWLNRPKSYDLRQMDMMVKLNAPATNVTFDWVDREPQPGQWDWSYPDHAVDAAQKRGLIQFGYVGNTAKWALPEGVPPEHSYRHPPAEKHTDAFRKYCETVTKRYKGRVEHFQFWNEPNGCSWINDGCSNGHMFESYTHWLKIAYEAMKDGNPDCKVCAAALDYNEGVREGYKYIEGMYKSGAKGYFDAISIHPYHPEGLFWGAVEDTYRVMKENGDADKRLWLTEYGWVDAKGEDAARKLNEVLTRLASPEFHCVEMANYLCITDLPIEGTEQYGLCDRELNPRPVAKAFQELAKGSREALGLKSTV